MHEINKNNSLERVTPANLIDSRRKFNKKRHREKIFKKKKKNPLSFPRIFKKLNFILCFFFFHF